ncbi:MAG: hypothetical protein R2791_15375 [Saprospiraceae bacterium]
MISRAYIFGTLGKAAFQQQGEWFVLDADSPEDVRKWHPLDRNLFTLTVSTPETLYLEGEKKLGDLKKLLVLETKKHQALTLSLQLMDKRIAKEGLKNALAKLLETYLSLKPICEFVENRLFTTVVPDTFDPAAALEVCQALQIEKSTGIYESLYSSRDHITEFYTIWQKLGKEHFNNIEAFDTAYSLLTESGIAKQFVLSLASLDRMQWDGAAVKATYLLQKHQLLQNAALFSQMRQELKNLFNIHLNEQHAESSKLEKRDEIEQMIEEYLEAYNRSRAVKRSRKDLAKLGRQKKDRKRVRQQVVFTDVSELQTKISDYSDKIAKAAQMRNFVYVEEYLIHLLSLQFKYSDPQHICKSLCNIAVAAINIGATDLARRLLGYAKLINSEDPVVYTQFAEVLKAEGDFAAAKAEYARIKHQFPESIVAQNGYADILKAEGNLTAAKAEYARIKCQFPNDVVAHNCYAEVLKAEGEIAAAKAEYALIKSRFEKDEFAQNGYAEVLKAEGNFTAAKAEYARIKREFPESAVAQNGYAEILKAEGDFAAAKAEYAYIKRQFPNDVFAQNGYAEVLKAEGNFTAAKAEYTRIKRLFPNNVVAQNGYAEVLKAEGNLTTAKAEYEAIISKHPYNQVALHALCCISLSLGEKITFAFPVPENPRTEQDYYWHLFHINSQMKSGNWDNAEKMLREGLNRCPFQRQKLAYKRVLRYMALQKHDLDPILTEVSDTKTDHPLDHALIAHFFAIRGQKDRAKSELEKTRQFSQFSVINNIVNLISARIEQKEVHSIEALDAQLREQELDALVLTLAA